MWLGDMGGDAESLLTNTQNSICSHLPCGPAEEWQSALKMWEESLELVALGREVKEQMPGSLYWVIPHTEGAIFLRQSNPLQVASAWGKVTALPTGIPLPHPVGLKLCCWEVQLEDIHSLSLTENLQAKLGLSELRDFSWPSPRPGAD